MLQSTWAFAVLCTVPSLNPPPPAGARARRSFHSRRADHTPPPIPSPPHTHGRRSSGRGGVAAAPPPRPTLSALSCACLPSPHDGAVRSSAAYSDCVASCAPCVQCSLSHVLSDMNRVPSDPATLDYTTRARALVLAVLHPPARAHRTTRVGAAVRGQGCASARYTTHMNEREMIEREETLHPTRPCDAQHTKV